MLYLGPRVRLLLVHGPTPRHPGPTLFPYTTLFRSHGALASDPAEDEVDRRQPAARLERLDQHGRMDDAPRSEEHTSELQSQFHLVCRLLLGKKNPRSPRLSRE